MTSLDEVRIAVIRAFRAVHQANYPTTKVNYPDHLVVDLEHQSEPFISVEIDLTGVTHASMGEKDILVPGILHVIHYSREGTGTSQGLKYLDMLNGDDGLALKQVGEIFFNVAKPIPVKTFPEWKGLMCSMRFDLSKGTICEV